MPATYVGGSLYIVSNSWPRRFRRQFTNEGVGRGLSGGENLTRVSAQNYSVAQFIAPIKCLIPGPSPVPGPARVWGCKIHGSCVSTTLQPQFWSGQLPIYVRVKGFPQVLSLWVNSNLWVRQRLHSRTYHTLRGQTEKVFPLFMTVLTVFIFILLLPKRQELIHWIFPVGFCVQVSKYDVNYGVSLYFP